MPLRSSMYRLCRSSAVSRGRARAKLARPSDAKSLKAMFKTNRTRETKDWLSEGTNRKPRPPKKLVSMVTTKAGQDGQPWPAALRVRIWRGHIYTDCASTEMCGEIRYNIMPRSGHMHACNGQRMGRFGQDWRCNVKSELELPLREGLVEGKTGQLTQKTLDLLLGIGASTKQHWAASTHAIVENRVRTGPNKHIHPR